MFRRLAIPLQNWQKVPNSAEPILKDLEVIEAQDKQFAGYRASAVLQEKNKQREAIRQENRHGLPRHYNHDALMQHYGSYLLRSHQEPDFYLSHVDHEVCYHHFSISDVLKEADLLNCESQHAEHCRAILKQFKALIHRYPQQKVERLFSIATYEIEKRCFEEQIKRDTPFIFRLLCG